MHLSSVFADDGRSMQVRLSASACWGAEHPSDSQQSVRGSMRFNHVGVPIAR